LFILEKYMRKKTFITVCFLLLSFFAKAQSLNEKLVQQFLRYNQLIIDKNFEEAVNYTMEDVFKIVTKEQLIHVLKQTMSTPGLEVKIALPTPSDFQPMKTIGSKNYVRFINNSIIDMKLTDDGTKSTTSISTLKAVFEKQFGAGNVTYDEPSGYFKIKSKKKVIARSPTGSEDWKFAVIDTENQKKLLSLFIPAEILE